MVKSEWLWFDISTANACMIVFIIIIAGDQDRADGEPAA